MLTDLFSHEGAHQHMHFFNALHVQNLLVLVAGIIVVFTLVKHFKKETR